MIRTLAGQDRPLHRRAARDRLVRVGPALRQPPPAEPLGEQLLHLRDPRRSAHHDHLGHRRGVHAGVRQHGVHGREGPRDEVGAEGLELLAGDLQVEVAAAGHLLEGDALGGGGGEEALGALARRAHAAQRAGVACGSKAEGGMGVSVQKSGRLRSA